MNLLTKKVLIILTVLFQIYVTVNGVLAKSSTDLNLFIDEVSPYRGTYLFLASLLLVFGSIVTILILIWFLKQQNFKQLIILATAKIVLVLLAYINYVIFSTYYIEFGYRISYQFNFIYDSLFLVIVILWSMKKQPFSFFTLITMGILTFYTTIKILNVNVGIIPFYEIVLIVVAYGALFVPMVLLFYPIYSEYKIYTNNITTEDVQL